MRGIRAGGEGLRSFGAALRNNFPLGGPVRPAPVATRPVCRPVLLAPGPGRSLRRPRSRLVTTNFKPSDNAHEEDPAIRPKHQRHPLTVVGAPADGHVSVATARLPLQDDPFAGALPSETATQGVIFNSGLSAAAAASPQEEKGFLKGFLRSSAEGARQFAQLLTRPRALLRAIARNSIIGLPFVLAYLARQPLQSFWVSYCVALDGYPLLTKIATGIVGTIIGDVVAQQLSHRADVGAARKRGVASPQFAFDLARTARMTIYGAAVVTPMGHAWFQFLDTHIMPEAMTSMQAVLTKMSMDQLLMCPLMTAVFFVVMRSWEGHPQDALPYMLGKILPTLRANYMLWPAAHIINFAFVPPEHRILYCSAVGVVWTVILSMILNARTPPPVEVGTKPVPGGGGGGGGGSASGGGPSAASDRMGGGMGRGPRYQPTGPVEVVGGLADAAPGGSRTARAAGGTVILGRSGVAKQQPAGAVSRSRGNRAARRI